jgi:hypothetical protein
VRVCRYTPVAAPQARAARHVPDASRPDRSPDPVSGPDVGPNLVQVGHVADAQIAGLQDYITRVCRVQ